MILPRPGLIEYPIDLNFLENELSTTTLNQAFFLLKQWVYVQQNVKVHSTNADRENRSVDTIQRRDPGVSIGRCGIGVALRSTSYGRWRGRPRRTPACWSTSAGRWTGRPGWSLRSRPSIFSPGERWSTQVGGKTNKELCVIVRWLGHYIQYMPYVLQARLK